MAGCKPVNVPLISPTPVPVETIRVLAVVGAVAVLSTKPLSVTSEPPSLTTSPAIAAVLFVRVPIGLTVVRSATVLLATVKQ